LVLKQADFPGGIQIWGSNPAIVWTASRHEKAGIHVHAFRRDGDGTPERDETFSEVVIDGVRLDEYLQSFRLSGASFESADDATLNNWQ
jgi:hypothetical protein